MSLAGPASNLALALAAGIAIRVGLEAGVFYPPDSVSFTQVTASVAGGLWDGVSTLLSILFTLNLLLFIFNLIPVPPLDGSGAIALLLDADTARRLQQFMSQPMFSMLGILVAWFLIGPLFSPIHLFALNLLYPDVSYH
jgi:Zn-dependent protease